VLCFTSAIESLNARYRRAVKARGHFPTEQAPLKCLYLVTRSLDPTGTGRTKWAMRWKPALNAFAITFSDRFPDAGVRRPIRRPPRRVCLAGGAKGIRTPDLLHAMQALYQLSYSPFGVACCPGGATPVY
jgi:hypothetical protein